MKTTDGGQNYYKKPHSAARRVKKLGRSWASRAELYRYLHLKRLENQGLIHDLRVQPRYAIILSGQKVCDFIGDFDYYTTGNQGRRTLEDVKGRILPIWRLKAKLVATLYPDTKLLMVRRLRPLKGGRAIGRWTETDIRETIGRKTKKPPKHN